jgi:hypothetical protein
MWIKVIGEVAVLIAGMIAYSLSTVSFLMTFAGSASAEDLGSVIALPDAPFVIPVQAQQRNVTTQLNNNARQGAYLAETTLNPTNVQTATFGILHMQMVQGQVLAQPLYVRDVDIDGIGRRNLVIVATAANMVYALDANDLSLVFAKNLTGDAQNPTKPVQQGTNSDVSVCDETYPPFIGVTSTPVIDVATGAVFVEGFNPFTVKQELHKLNLHDAFRSDQKVDIAPPGTNDKWPKYHRNRPGLLLANGIVYVAFASFICDNPQPYSGWVIGYDENDLHEVSQWDTPNFGDKGSSGIWQSGRGLVASDDGDIYFMTGNDSNLDLQDHTSDTKPFTDPRLANSFVRLRPSPSTCKDINRDKVGYDCGLVLVNSFSPKNSSQLSVGDTDLGSSGPILLPGNILVGGGKQGRVYVLNPSNMPNMPSNMPNMLSLQDHDKPGSAGFDGFEGFPAFTNRYHTDSRQNSCTKPFDNDNPDKYCRELHTENLLLNKKCPIDNNCYVPSSCYQYCQPYGPNIHAGFVYWQPAFDWGLIYAMPEKEHVTSFKYDILQKKVEETPVAKSQFLVPDGMPGGALSISANGNHDGIVWVSMPKQADATMGVHRGILYALDAKDLHTLWNSDFYENGRQVDCTGYFAKFSPPTVADGRVFLATFADPRPDPIVTPGTDCGGADPPLPDPSAMLNKPGRAWIIEYGLK